MEVRTYVPAVGRGRLACGAADLCQRRLVVGAAGGRRAGRLVFQQQSGVDGWLSAGCRASEVCSGEYIKWVSGRLPAPHYGMNWRLAGNVQAAFIRPSTASAYYVCRLASSRGCHRSCPDGPTHCPFYHRRCALNTPLPPISPWLTAASIHPPCIATHIPPLPMHACHTCESTSAAGSAP